MQYFCSLSSFISDFCCCLPLCALRCFYILDFYSCHSFGLSRALNETIYKLYVFFRSHSHSYRRCSLIVSTTNFYFLGFFLPDSFGFLHLVFLERPVLNGKIIQVKKLLWYHCCYTRYSYMSFICESVFMFTQGVNKRNQN